MRQLFLRITILILFYPILSCQAAKKTDTSESEVYFIPTIHKFHKSNQKYSYESLCAIVQKINPDIIAVEIRDIDINEDTTVLNKTYPHEFVMMKRYFPTKKIVGFDWWSKDIETIKASDLPQNYFQNTAKAKQSKLLESDSINRKKMMVCMQYQKERAPIIQNMSLEQILTSNDGELVKSYYDCLDKQLKGTPYYDSFVKASDERNVMILKNIKKIIRENKGKRILILTGDDHFQLLKDKFPNKQP